MKIFFISQKFASFDKLILSYFGREKNVGGDRIDVYRPGVLEQVSLPTGGPSLRRLCRGLVFCVRAFKQAVLSKSVHHQAPPSVLSWLEGIS